MKVASAILVICVVVTATSIDNCVQDTYPQYHVRGTAYQLKEQWLMPDKESWNIDIPSVEICNHSKPTAVSVTVCEVGNGRDPSISIFNLQKATIRSNAFPIQKSEAVVYVSVFCQTNNTAQRSQDESSELSLSEMFWRTRE